MASLQGAGGAGNRIAIGEKQREQREIHKDGEVRACHGVAGDLGGVHHVVHAHQRGQRGAHGDAGVEVHPRRQHAAHALRQHDEAEDLAAAKGQRLGRLPLRAGNGLDGSPEDLGHVGAGGQGQAQHHLDPVGERKGPAHQLQLEREHIGGEVDEHQDGRIAKQLHIQAHAGAHGRRGRQRQGAQHQAGHGADGHGQHADLDVDQEAAQQRGQPFP